MLKIKLLRIGKRKQPSFRIIVAEARSRQGGKNVALLGYYNPMVSPKEIKIDKKLYEEWVKKGAQPTDKVKKLIKKA